MTATVTPAPSDSGHTCATIFQVAIHHSPARGVGSVPPVAARAGTAASAATVIATPATASIRPTMMANLFT